MEELDARVGQLWSPVNIILHCPPQRTLCSDASKSIVRGYVVQSGRYWWYDLTTDDKSRFGRSSKQIVGMQNIAINTLELLGMVVSASLLFMVSRQRPVAVGVCVLLGGDYDAAIAGIQCCRGGDKPRSVALMHLLGMLEVSSGWYFQETHV